MCISFVLNVTGSNILLARMATKKAKPDGQYHLQPDEVDDFIRGQLVTNLPGKAVPDDGALWASVLFLGAACLQAGS